MKYAPTQNAIGIPAGSGKPKSNDNQDFNKYSVAINPGGILLRSTKKVLPVDRNHHQKFLKEHCKFAVIFVAEHFGVPICDLMSRTRSGSNAASARQIAAYVAHTTLSISYAKVAEFFHRDRTTISYACKQIEDRRDDKCFDAKLCMVESLVGDAVNFTVACDKESARSNEINTSPKGPIH